ncbi:replication associated protein' [Porcine circovirus 1]|uniref:Replication associated protein n=1 Tax=Porcine circovirus 1 TaxID=133704 RepID=A0A1J0F542_PCV1|nr:replication associated protein' [Porcine circovirus 1]
MPSKKSGPQPHKRWVFTLNNPSEEEKNKIRELPISLFDYFVCGEEGLEEGRTPHLQGFANFAKKQTFNKVKWYFGARCHIEKAKGTDQQNKEYCSKEGHILIECGAPRNQGKRSDLSTAYFDYQQSGPPGMVLLNCCPSCRSSLSEDYFFAILEDCWRTIHGGTRRPI